MRGEGRTAALVGGRGRVSSVAGGCAAGGWGVAVGVAGGEVCAGACAGACAGVAAGVACGCGCGCGCGCADVGVGVGVGVGACLSVEIRGLCGVNGRSSRRRSRTARPRATTPSVNTVRTTSTISPPMNRPQNSPYPESWAGGVWGQAAGRSWGAVASSRRASGERVNVTPSGQAPWERSPASPVAVQVTRVAARRRPRRPISRPSGMPPPWGRPSCPSWWAGPLPRPRDGRRAMSCHR